MLASCVVAAVVSATLIAKAGIVSSALDRAEAALGVRPVATKYPADTRTMHAKYVCLSNIEFSMCMPVKLLTVLLGVITIMLLCCC